MHRLERTGEARAGTTKASWIVRHEGSQIARSGAVGVDVLSDVEWQARLAPISDTHIS